MRSDFSARFRLDSDVANDLRAQFGTPLYVIDESTIRDRARRYQAAFRAAYPRTELAFACKANSTLAVLKILSNEGFGIDVASPGELSAALRAGISAAHCHFHGNFKTRDDLSYAIAAGIGAIMVDSFEEIEILVEICPNNIPLVLRLSPGVDPKTHQRISTGQADSKFGFNISDGSAAEAVQKVTQAGLNLIGYHCHVGSQLLDPEAQRAGGEQLARFAIDMIAEGFIAKYLNIGGGLGVHYTDADDPMPVEEYCRLVTDAIIAPLTNAGYPLDQLTLAQEPGRALVAEAGVTLYSVGPVKATPVRTFVAVDGGLSDNPRPAMYQSAYDVELMRDSAAPPVKVTISGRHCESDELFRDVAIPADVRTGDLLQVFTTGAYNSSMASNYNRFLRPASVLIRRDGNVAVIQARETIDQVLAREIMPEDLA